MLERVSSPRFRYTLYAIIALLLFAISLIKPASPLRQPFGFVVSDGRSYYVYLPSLVLDGDLDFANQIREHWEVDYDPGLLDNRTEQGYVANKYPIGVALSAAPGFLAGHAVACLLHPVLGWQSLAIDGYSPPYQFLSFSWITFLGIASLCLVDFLVSNCFRIGPVATFLAVVVCWASSPLLYYMTREPFMAHVVSCFWVNLCLVQLFLLGRKHPGGVVQAWRLFVLTAALAMALVCRPTNVFLAPFFVYVLSRLAKTGQLGRLIRVIPAIATGMLPVALQAFVWKRMTGHWVYYSYGAEGFDWLHPAAWQTLFSSRHGLFFWSPLLLLAMAGLTWRLVATGRRPEPFLVCSLLALLSLWYFNSAWHCWWFGDAFGGRAFIEGIAVFAAGFAFLFDRAYLLPRPARVLGSGVLAMGILGQFALVGLYAKGWIPHDGYLF
jgi:hypothetical protein